MHCFHRAVRSRNPASVIGVVLVLLVGGPQVRAAQSAATATSAATPDTHGLLWKVERRGYMPSYIFGTIHVADPRVTKLPSPVQDAFNASSHLVVEMVPDADGLHRLAQAMRFDDGRTLKQTIGARMYADVRTALVKRRTPLDDLDQYKPWAVTLVLSMPGSDGGVPLDFALQLLAARQGHSIEGLETVDEQIAVFDGMTLDDQRALLEASLRDQADLAERVEALVRAYVARDLGKLMALSEDDAINDPALNESVTRRLLTDRNRRMVARMQSRLRRGNAFIAVGAAHLPGPKGILKLLEQNGYRISAVY